MSSCVDYGRKSTGKRRLASDFIDARVRRLVLRSRRVFPGLELAVWMGAEAINCARALDRSVSDARTFTAARWAILVTVVLATSQEAVKERPHGRFGAEGIDDLRDVHKCSHRCRSLGHWYTD